MTASFLISHYKSRTCDYTITLTESDGSTAVNVAAGDVVRVKIGRVGSTPSLDIDSVGATASGSLVTVSVGSNICTLRIAQGDVANMTPGAYDCEVALVDDSETGPADAIKSAESGVFFLHGTQGGDVGLS